jgi:glycosyltransferase involved in cell wall biosynthesis
LIVEPHGSGHRVALYVRHVIRKLLLEKCSVSLLTTSSAVAHPSFKLLEEFRDSLKIYLHPELPAVVKKSSLRLFAQQVKSWLVLHRATKDIIDNHRVDVIYLPTSDWVVKAIEIFGSPFKSTPFVMLYMSPKHHRKEMGLGPPGRNDWLYKKMFDRLLRISSLKKIFVIDDAFVEFCGLMHGGLSEKIQYIPDFGEINGEATKQQCRGLLGVPPSSRLLLVYGSLTKRKGIIQLLKAAAEPQWPSTLQVLLAGKVDKEIESVIKAPFVQKMSSDGRILFRLFFHDDAEEYCVFTAADFVWLGYENFYGSSGVLYQAVKAGKLVVATREGLIGRYVKKSMLGVTVDASDVGSILSGLNEISIKDNGEIEKKRDDLIKFSRTHSPEAHASEVFTNLDKARSR